jgi:hypothetical protein
MNDISKLHKKTTTTAQLQINFHVPTNLLLSDFTRAFGAVDKNCIAKIIKHNSDYLRETDSNKLETIA